LKFEAHRSGSEQTYMPQNSKEMSNVRKNLKHDKFEDQFSLFLWDIKSNCPRGNRNVHSNYVSSV